MSAPAHRPLSSPEAIHFLDDDDANDDVTLKIPTKKKNLLSILIIKAGAYGGAAFSDDWKFNATNEAILNARERQLFSFPKRHTLTQRTFRLYGHYQQTERQRARLLAIRDDDVSEFGETQKIYP